MCTNHHQILGFASSSQIRLFIRSLQGKPMCTDHQQIFGFPSSCEIQLFLKSLKNKPMCSNHQQKLSIEQLADVFTKTFRRYQFDFLKDKLKVIDISSGLT